MANFNDYEPIAYRQKYLRWYCQKILPAVYDDSLSYYELLNKVVAYLNDTVNTVNKNAEITDELNIDIIELKKEIDELNEHYKKFEEGGFIDIYIESLLAWIDKNLIELVGRIVKFVSFELDDSGRLIANIPYTWKFLTFDTIMNGDSPRYGCLVIQY